MVEKANLKSREELKADLARENFKRKTISFYKYVKITDPKAMRDFLFDNLNEMRCLGRIYVAEEGINAQMNVPEQHWHKFDNFIQKIQEFAGVQYKFAVEENQPSSFLKLIIKVRQKIVADGLKDFSFNPADTGEYVLAEEANAMIEQGKTVIDMRNLYESAIGHFENAKIMNVDTFREQLKKLHEVFADKRDEEILLYCTGGIRCEKASAWMKHNGFKNVKHLKGGIIDYAHRVKELGLQNKFRGKNFVFDERLGERIGAEIIAYCQVCEKEKCDDYLDCRNDSCHALFICCQNCKQKLGGYCGRICMICDKFPKKLNQMLIGKNRQKHQNQFKKHYKSFKYKNEVGLLKVK